MIEDEKNMQRQHEHGHNHEAEGHETCGHDHTAEGHGTCGHGLLTIMPETVIMYTNIIMTKHVNALHVRRKKKN